MKIQEISKILNINHETVRMYRQKGLLKPVRNPKNGYYEYDSDDLFSLFFIRKLRGANISLPAITKIFASESVTDMVSSFDAEIAGVESQIKALERKLDTLTRTRRHLAECSFETNEVTTINVADAKYDIIDFQSPEDALLRPWLDQPDLCTLSLCIKKECLNQPPTKEPVPAAPGFGTYKKIVDKHRLPLSETMSVCPKGLYLSCLIELDNLTLIPAEKLLPLQEYARTNKLRFTSNTTAFLISIDRHARQTTYRFRLRACVAEIG